MLRPSPNTGHNGFLMMMMMMIAHYTQTAALERQPDGRASLRQNGTGGGRVFAGWIWIGLALWRALNRLRTGGWWCENSVEEMGLSRRRPVGGLRLRGATDDGPPPLLPPT